MTNEIDWPAPENQQLRIKCKLRLMRTYRTQEEWEDWLLETVIVNYGSVDIWNCFFCEACRRRGGWRDCKFCYGLWDDAIGYPCTTFLNESERFCNGWDLIKAAFQEENQQ